MLYIAFIITAIAAIIAAFSVENVSRWEKGIMLFGTVAIITFLTAKIIFHLFS